MGHLIKKKCGRALYQMKSHGIFIDLDDNLLQFTVTFTPIKQSASIGESLCLKGLP